MSNVEVVATAPGKLMLLGEYSVLYGAPALVAAVPYRVSVKVSFLRGVGPSEIVAPQLHFQPVLCEIGQSHVLSFIGSNCSSDLLKHLGWVGVVLGGVLKDVPTTKQQGLRLRLEFNSAALHHQTQHCKLGFGSSAALVVAFDGALRVLLGQSDMHVDRSPMETFSSLEAMHRRIQGGLGSGADVAASYFAGVQRVRRQVGPHPTPLDVKSMLWPAGLHLVAVWTGRSASTVELVSHVAALRTQDPAQFSLWMDQLTSLSVTGSQLWCEAKTQELLAVIHSFYSSLMGLSVASGAEIISNEHCQLAALVGSTGAAYKPSGAGGGDFGLAWCVNAAQAQQVTTRCSAAGFEAMALMPEQQGLEVLVTRSA